VLRFGSKLCSISLFKFFTFCWLRISRSSQKRWNSLRRRASSSVPQQQQRLDEAAQPLLQ
jgi:hypothetical protein